MDFRTALAGVRAVDTLTRKEREGKEIRRNSWHTLEGALLSSLDVELLLRTAD